MDSAVDIRIYNESCPQLEDLLKQIRRRPAARLGSSVMPLDGRYAAGVWKRLFMLTLSRLATEQLSLARFTAVEALHVVGASASPSHLYPQTAHARYLLSKLKQIGKAPLRGRTSPKKGFHPIDLQEWNRDAVRVFQNGVNEQDALDLWKRCSGCRSRMPKGLMLDLKRRRTPRSRAMAFVARVAGVEEEGLKVTLHRRKNATHSLQ